MPPVTHNPVVIPSLKAIMLSLKAVILNLSKDLFLIKHLPVTLSENDGLTLKKPLKVLRNVLLSIVGFFLLIIICLMVWGSWQYHLPPQKRVLQQFESHRADYIRFAQLILQNECNTNNLINFANTVHSDGTLNHKKGVVPEYRDLMHKIGAKLVFIRTDCSMRFTLWGYGGPLRSDSYMGVLYVPKDHDLDPLSKPILVSCVDSLNLPKESGDAGRVAGGFYIVPIEPDWFIYRLEIPE